MGKLYPPYIDSKLPGQQGNTIRIPYVHNRSVNLNEIQGFSLCVKTLSGLPVLQDVLSSSHTSNEVVFENISGLKEGQYYKAQIAYGKLEEGYWSDVGVFKYVSSSIKCDFDPEYFNTLSYAFNGIYNYRADLSEKPKYYCFTLYEDPEGTKVLETSGKQLYNSANDVEPGESHHSWVCSRARSEIDGGFIQYEVETVSGLVIKAGADIEITSLRPDPYLQSLHKLLIVENNYEKGCIDLKCRGKEGFILQGDFVIERADSKHDFSNWTVIHREDIPPQIFGEKEYEYVMWSDYTVEQGVSYQYQIQRFIQIENLDDGSSYKDWCDTEHFMHNTNGQWKDYIVADFEDMFLSDLGNENNELKQLKIKYNPKVSLFKPTILESKTDTIGGQYPYVFRNGDVRYYEFGLSGLISYLGDNESLFTKREMLGYISEYSVNNGGLNKLVGQSRSRTKETEKLPRSAHTNLTTDNFVTERDFRNQVISWLTDGKPKLLRTPAEGNFIVRLMNVSLSPNEQLSRMLYSFNCSAFEIAEYNTSNLVKYGLLAKPEVLRPGNIYVDIVDIDPGDPPYVDASMKAGTVLIDNKYIGTAIVDLKFDSIEGVKIKIKEDNKPYILCDKDKKEGEEEGPDTKKKAIKGNVDYLELQENCIVTGSICKIQQPTQKELN